MICMLMLPRGTPIADSVRSAIGSEIVTAGFRHWLLFV